MFSKTFFAFLIWHTLSLFQATLIVIFHDQHTLRWVSIKLGALDLWLREETCNQKVVRLNPDAGHWIIFFMFWNKAIQGTTSLTFNWSNTDSYSLSNLNEFLALYWIIFILFWNKAIPTRQYKCLTIHRLYVANICNEFDFNSHATYDLMVLKWFLT